MVRAVERGCRGEVPIVGAVRKDIVQVRVDDFIESGSSECRA